MGVTIFAFCAAAALGLVGVFVLVAPARARASMVRGGARNPFTRTVPFRVFGIVLVVIGIVGIVLASLGVFAQR